MKEYRDELSLAAGECVGQEKKSQEGQDYDEARLDFDWLFLWDYPHFNSFRLDWSVNDWWFFDLRVSFADHGSEVVLLAELDGFPSFLILHIKSVSIVRLHLFLLKCVSFYPIFKSVQLFLLFLNSCLEFILQLLEDCVLCLVVVAFTDLNFLLNVLILNVLAFLFEEFIDFFPS